MSGAGAPTSQPFDASDLRVAVVAASWHTQVMDGLVAGAERALAAYGIERRRRSSGCPAPSSCPSSRRRWRRRGTTPWWRSAS